MSVSRLDRLYDAIKSSSYDGLVLNPGSTLYYLTGLQFHLMERPVVLFFSPGKTPALVLPELEAAKLQQITFPIQPFTYGETISSWKEAFKRAGQSMDLSGKQIGVEPTRLRYLELEFLKEALPGAKFIPGGDALTALRLCKDAGEIQCMRQAVQIAQKGLDETIPLIKAGMTERQLAAELSLQLLRAGSDPEFPFQPIIASGPNSANPHAVPSERKLAPGDLVVIDWGAAYLGYAADLTRTLAIAEVDAELASITRIVAQANAAGRNAGKPGIPASQVDAAARQVIDDSGYGKYFIHRTGHGLGLEAHEEPYISANNPLILAPGMVYTIEPGIYLPNRGGSRIEDNVVVTASGSESLSNMVRDLIVVG